MNLDDARANMVKQQVRTWEVFDKTILSLMQAIPREHFVPQALRNIAFADTALPLSRDQQMEPPKEVGRTLQALAIEPHDTVLEIGTGSGYMTYLLAKLAREIVSVDIYEEFTALATSKLNHFQDARHVHLETGDAIDGWQTDRRFDVIVINSAYPLFPTDLRRQLSINGRLFVIVGQAPAMQAYLVTRHSESDWSQTCLFETVRSTMVNATIPDQFIF